MTTAFVLKDVELLVTLKCSPQIDGDEKHICDDLCLALVPVLQINTIFQLFGNETIMSMKG